MEEEAAKNVPAVERFKKEAIRIFATPFIMLFTESIVGLLTLYMAIGEHF